MAHLLVIDDDADVRHLIRRYLEEAGHSVIEAEDGYAGLTAFRRAAIDLVITDIFMPEQDGIETIRMLRKLRPTIRIIAISGGIVGDRIYLREAKALGADGVLSKPFRREDLLNLVDACLGDRPCAR
jgi:CheY-like chemotaxis protein